MERTIDQDQLKSKGDREKASVKSRSKENLDLGLYTKDGNALAPLTYTSGKKQSKVVEEILEAFESTDIVFLWGVVGSGKCLEKGTLIHTPDGMRRIESLNEGDEVYTWNVDGITTSGIEKTFEFNENVVRVETEHGYTISGTRDHKIVVLDENCEFRWRELGEIREGDYVPIIAKETGGKLQKLDFSSSDKEYEQKVAEYKEAMELREKYGWGPLRISEKTGIPLRRVEGWLYQGCSFVDKIAPLRVEYLDEDICELLGYWVNGGRWVENEKRCIVEFSVTDFKLKRKICEILRKIGLNPVEGKTKVLVYSIELKRFLSELGLETGAENKLVPEVVFRSPLKCRVAFLWAYYGGGGSLDNKNMIETITKSRKLAHDLQKLLLSLGIYSSLRRKEISNYETFYRLTVLNRSKPTFLSEVEEFHTKSSGSFESSPNNDPDGGVPYVNVFIREMWEKFRDNKHRPKAIDEHDVGRARRLSGEETSYADIGKKLSTNGSVVWRYLNEESKPASVREKDGFSPHNEAENRLGFAFTTLGSYVQNGQNPSIRTLKGITSPPDFNCEAREISKEIIELNPLFSRVKRISRGKCQVYDATVSNSHNYIAHGIISHNSVIGIRTALEFGGGVVSVPTKVLSHQYRDDYEGDKYFLSEGGEKAEIRVLKGRGNFVCPYIEEKHPEWKYNTCQSRSLPCTRPLRRDESRLEALEECPYWGFIFPASTALRVRREHVGDYRSLVGKHSLLLKGKCPYWKQYRSYLSADVNVINSAKWEIESRIGRLPLSEVTIIDESDGWLDGLCSKVSITERRIGYLSDALGEEGLDQGAEEVKGLWNDYKEGFQGPLNLAKSLHKTLERMDFGTNLYWQLTRILDFEDEVVAEAGEDRVTYYIPDPRPVLTELRNRIGGKWLLMSATVQSKEVLNRIYGIDPTFVEGEIEFPGKLIQKKLGTEVRVNNRRWRERSFRRKYRSVRDEVLRRASRPGFVPVHATKYLPENFSNLTDRDQVELDGLTFSTKMDRGADLKGMKSVVLLKYPFPDLSDPLLRATRERLGEEKFWKYYRDMSRREFIQQVGRTTRVPEDEVEFWSPDEKCHERLRQDWKGKIVGE